MVDLIILLFIALKWISSLYQLYGLITVLIYSRKTGGNKFKHLGVIIEFLVDKTWSNLEP